MPENKPLSIAFSDKDDYSILYAHYFSKLFNYGHKFTTDSVLIEDSIQDVFLDYWKRRNILKEPSSLNSYLFTAFRYSLFNKLSKAKKIVAMEGVEEPDFASANIFYAKEEDAVRSAQLRAALEQLTPRQREALFLRFYEGLSYETIAEIMNISVKASYKLMARSLAHLKECLTPALFFALFQFPVLPK